MESDANRHFYNWTVARLLERKSAQVLTDRLKALFPEITFSCAQYIHEREWSVVLEGYASPDDFTRILNWADGYLYGVYAARELLKDL